MTNLTEDTQRQLYSLFKEFDLEDREVREQQIRRWKKYEYFWKGFQHLAWSESARDWQNPELDPDVFSDYLDETFYTKVFNIFRAHGESIIAALSTAVPGVFFTPDDANNPDDLETSKAYSKIAQLIQNHNKSKSILTKAIYTLYTQGTVFGYTYQHESNKYGTVQIPQYESVTQGTCTNCGASMPPQLIQCPTCGVLVTPSITVFPQLIGVSEQPKSRQILKIYGPVNVHIPIWCKTVEDTPYLVLREDWHYTKARAEFPEIADQIKDEEDPEEFEKWARQAVEDRFGRRGLAVVKKIWFRPFAFSALKDDAVRAELESNFPEGCCAIFVNDIFARAYPEKIDDAWVVSFDPRSEQLNADPVGAPLAPIQEVINEVFNLTVQTIEHSIPETFADPEVVDFDRYGNVQSRPGQLFPAKARPGQALGQSFETIKTATVSAEIEKFASKLEQSAQFVVGSFPSIYGGQMTGSRTAAEYQMSRQQALQRLSTTWYIVTQFWCDLMSISVRAFAMSMKGDEPLTTKVGESFITDWIRKSQLTGKVGSVDPEFSEQFPSSWAEKRDAILNLVQLQIPEVNGVLFHPDNASLVKSMTGLPELYVPGDADRSKQLREIKLLINSQPTQDPMSGQQMPSVMIDVEVDDHAAHIQVCKNYLVSEQGEYMKAANPSAYQNILAHLRMHQMVLEQLTAQQFERTEPGEEPESAAISTGA